MYPSGDGEGQEPETKVSDSSIRPYNHLINEEADSNLFNKVISFGYFQASTFIYHFCIYIIQTFPGDCSDSVETIYNDDDSDKK